MPSSSVPFLLGWGEIRRGAIELYEEVDLEAALSGENDACNPSSSSSSASHASKPFSATLFTSVCLLHLPAFLIPGDILKFFGAYVERMTSFRVFRHYSNPEKYLAVLELVSSEAASALVRDFHGQSLTSLEHAQCVVYPMKSLTFDALKDEDDPRINLTSATLGDDTAEEKHDDDVARAMENMVFHLAGDKMDSEFVQGVQAGEKHTANARGPAGDNCPLCLDRLSESSCFTTCCNHSFHIQCISRLEGPQCPVCRFQHDSTTEELSSCGVCGCQCDDLWVCLVCGFVGCGRTHGFHIKDHYLDYLHTYAMNVTNRCVWDFAGNGYVHRLILQARSDAAENDDDNNNDESDGSFHSRTAGGGSRSHGNSSGGGGGRGRSSTISVSSSSSSSSNDISGQDKAGSSADSAFNSPNRTARSNSFSALTSMMGGGGGRSNLSAASAGSNSGGGTGRGGMKLVEIPDPSHSSPTRRQRALLSSQQEELLINSKLEIAANQYNQLVTWQLQQHRERYEARLSRIQEHAFEEAAALAGHSSRGDRKGGEETWAQKVLQSLIVEKAKVIKQGEASKERLRLAREELDVLSKLNQSLASNQKEWQKRVDSALQTLTTAEQAYRQGVPKLEKTVRELMKRLEQTEADVTSQAASSSSSSSSSTSKEENESTGGEEESQI